MSKQLERRIEHLEVRARRVPSTVPVVLDEPADVLALLAEQVNVLRLDVGVDPAERARTCGLLAGLALLVMDSRDLAARLEAVERVLKLGRQDERAKAREGSKHHGR